MPPLLRIEKLTKIYPGVIANEDVSFEVDAGTIHALLGENGAGKSTLVKMIYGLVKPNSGTMMLAGEPYAPTAPRAARMAGVGMVFQHFKWFEAMSVTENIALGMGDAPRLDILAGRIVEVSQEYGLPLDPEQRVHHLSAGERQRVGIVRCLLQRPKILIMDEPTSVLTPQEVDRLFVTLRKLAQEGTAILYISHKLEEIRTLCDTATILRRGRVVKTCNPATQTTRSLAEMMVGKAMALPVRKQSTTGPCVLELRSLSSRAEGSFSTALQEVTLELNQGEILGIGGVAGNGQHALLAAISGEVLSPPGRIFLRGQDIGALGPSARRKRGLLSAPEERLGHAAVPNIALSKNAALTARHRQNLQRRGFLSWGAAQRFTQSVIQQFDVRTSGPSSTAQSLSGGNLQKFVVGREISQKPDVLVISQPTWGVDAASASTIHQALMNLAAEGTGVILISQDLDELLAISDRFSVLSKGQLREPLPTHTLSMEQIGMMLGGAAQTEDEREHETHG